MQFWGVIVQLSISKCIDFWIDVFILFSQAMKMSQHCSLKMEQSRLTLQHCCNNSNIFVLITIYSTLRYLSYIKWIENGWNVLQRLIKYNPKFQNEKLCKQNLIASHNDHSVEDIKIIKTFYIWKILIKHTKIYNFFESFSQVNCE